MSPGASFSARRRRGGCGRWASLPLAAGALGACLALLPASVAADEPSLVHATAALLVEFDEDRAWVTEFLEVAPTGPRAVPLAAEVRRFGLPAPAGTGGRAGLRVGGEPMAAVDLVGGALALPELVPPEGISAILEYSLPAEGVEVSFARRYPVALRELRVSATARVPGVSVRLGGASAARPAREAPDVWTAVARRTEPLAAGSPVPVRIVGLPAYETPAWASSLLLGGVLAALGGLGLAAAGRRRRP
ncbi:MAG: hypothetical protein JXB32_00195 [Deltaproteobacteria bacterium]|nr:hypothetical protein [Deltaproteobacteria bacterium]